MRNKKVVLITGGSSGLGKEIAENLSGEYRVVIMAQNIEELTRAAKEAKCDYVQGDVTNFTQCEKVINTILKNLGTIDILINNAGLWIEGDLIENDPINIQKVLNVNLLGPIYMSKAILPEFKRKKSGLIININSQSGLTEKKDRSVYYASKWGLRGFSKSLRLDVHQSEIGLIEIYPGKIKTRFFQRAGNTKDLSDALEPEQVVNAIKHAIQTYPNTYTPEISVTKQP